MSYYLAGEHRIGIREQIKEELQDFLNDNTISNASVKAVLIKKTSSRNVLEKFSTHKFQITDGMAQKYRELFLDSLQSYEFTKEKILIFYNNLI